MSNAPPAGGSVRSLLGFAADLTDVEVALTVTDTLAIQTRTYRSELSTPFQPILATDAFGTCDL